MNILLFLPLFTFIFSAGLGLLVLLKKARSSINQIFALLCFETAYWQLCWFLSYLPSMAMLKDPLSRIAFSVIIFIPFTYYHVAILFLKLSSKKNYVHYGYIFGVFFLILTWSSHLFIEGYRDFWWGSYPKAGPFFSIYLIGAIFFITRALFLILQATQKKHLPALEQNKIKFMALAHFLYYFAAIEYLIDYGIPLYPIGVFFFIASFSIIAYAITKHRLMDINIAIKKGLAYSIIAAIFTGLYLVIIYITTHSFENIFGIGSLGIGAVLLFTSALLFQPLKNKINQIAVLLFTSALLFQPLKNKINQIIDKLFFKSSYEYQVTLKNMSKKIAIAASLNELNTLVSKEIKEVLKVRGAKIQRFE